MTSHRTLLKRILIGTLIVVAIALASLAETRWSAETIDGVTVDAGVWHRDVNEDSAETALVRDADPVLALAALKRVADRVMRVDENGVEYAATDELPTELYTPNYSDASMRDRGPELYIDCKGEIEDAMGDRFVAILREELAAAGIKHAHVVTA